MRNYASRIAFWLALILVLVAAVLIVSTSPSFQICVNSGYSDSGKQPFKENITAFCVLIDVYRDCTGGFVHTFADQIIALFTVILAASTIALWASTARLVRGTEDTAERQLRAYVGIEKLEIDAPNVITHPLAAGDDL